MLASFWVELLSIQEHVYSMINNNLMFVLCHVITSGGSKVGGCGVANLCTNTALGVTNTN